MIILISAEYKQGVTDVKVICFKDGINMRSFIAVDFSRQLKSEIAGLQSMLRSHAASGRWKYIGNFHLTLKFLDEIDLKKVSEISDKMREICAGTEKFKLGISELGNFPGKECLRVLWLGIGGELDRLNSFQNKIDAALEGMGFRKENRSYTPHITIGQDVVFYTEFGKIKELAGVSRMPEFLVEKAYLFKSEQVGGRRIYTPVNEFKLKGG